MRRTPRRPESCARANAGSSQEGVRVDVRNLSSLCSLPKTRIRGLIRFILRHEKVRRGEINVLLVSAARIRRLNKKFLSRDDLTDVLAFDVSGGASSAGALFGDVVVCVDAARRASKKYRVPFEEELRRYLIHGVLHLLGYNDLSGAARRRMWRRQETFVKKSARIGLGLR